MTKIELNRAALVAALTDVLTVAEKRSPAPVLTAVHLRIEGMLATLTATDLDMDRSAIVAIEGDDIVPGEVEALITSPRRLLAVLKAAKGDLVRLDVKPAHGDDKAAQHWHIGTLETVTSSELHVDDFPRPKVITDEWSALVGGDFARALARVSPAISTEETRYYLNGIAMRHVGGWSYRLAASDGHRLHIAQVELPDAPDAPWKGDVIIPRKAVDVMRAVLAGCKWEAALRFGNSAPSNAAPATLADAPGASARDMTRMTLHPQDETGWMVSKLIDAHFPDVMRVVPVIPPEGARLWLRADRRALIDAVRAVSVGLRKGAVRALRLTLVNDGQTLRIATASCGEGLASAATVAADASVEAGKCQFTVGFNGQYLLDTLRSFTGDEAVLEWDQGPEVAARWPCKITDPCDDKFFAVLMPMRL